MYFQQLGKSDNQLGRERTSVLGFPIADNLAAYYTLDEASGTRADSVNSNDLSDINTVGSTTGKVGNAASFVAANQEVLRVADTAVLRADNSASFAVGAWVNLSSLVNSTIIGKYRLDNNTREYLLFFAANDSGTVNRFKFAVSNDGTSPSTVVANNFGLPSTSTWYYVIAWHDAVADTINISVNNGTADSAAHTTGVFGGGGNFQVGALQVDGTTNTYYMNGLIDEAFKLDKAPSADERSFLYNSGNGRTYAEILSYTG